MCQFTSCRKKGDHHHCSICTLLISQEGMCEACETGVPTSICLAFLRQSQTVMIYRIRQSKFCILGRDTTRRFLWGNVLFWVHKGAMRLVTPSSACITPEGMRIANPALYAPETVAKNRERLREYRATHKPPSARKPRIDLWRPRF